jgi:NAD(P)H dehydrogenase (quinone)
VIAVTGATGVVGGLVAERLAALGHEQRLIVRDASRAPSLDGATVAVALQYGMRSDMRRALEGIDTLFLVPAAESVDRVEQHLTAVAAADAERVRRVVYLSFVNAAPDATFTLARHHWATEERIRATGMAFTFLRMSLYLDFLGTMVGIDGAIRGPAGDGHFAPVARADIADVAVALLLAGDGEHDGRTYDVTGGERMTMAEAAAAVGARFEDETLEQAYASRSGHGVDDWEVAGWVTSYAAIRAGELDVLTDNVERLAGHPPRTLADLT